jgi:hypothetical protein
MLPKLPGVMSSIANQIPRAKSRRAMTTEEKIAKIKKEYGLTHGKGKRKRKNKKKK